MNDGYIKISRKSLDNPLYFSEPFSKWHAWCDLIMLARYKDSEFTVRGIKVNAKRGCVYMSSQDLADRWKWSRGKVLRFLDGLEMVQQIVQQKSNVITCISISNYDTYQCDGTTNGTTNGTTEQEKKKEAKKNKKDRKQEYTPYNPPQGDLFGEIKVPTFEEFYKAYPRKRGKAEASRAWDKLSDADKIKAFDSIDVYKNDCIQQERDIRYPATYLNGKTFNDEFNIDDNGTNNTRSSNTGYKPTHADYAREAELRQIRSIPVPDVTED